MIDGAIVAVVLFLIGQLIASVWWASRTNTILSIVQRELSELITELRAMRENYVNKNECTKFQSNCSQQIKAMWDKIDNLKKGE